MVAATLCGCNELATRLDYHCGIVHTLFKVMHTLYMVVVKWLTNIKTLPHEIKVHVCLLECMPYVGVGLSAVSNMSSSSSVSGSGMLSKSSSETMRWQVEQHRVPSHAAICNTTYIPSNGHDNINYIGMAIGITKVKAGSNVAITPTFNPLRPKSRYSSSDSCKQNYFL